MNITLLFLHKHCITSLVYIIKIQKMKNLEKMPQEEMREVLGENSITRAVDGGVGILKWYLKLVGSTAWRGARMIAGRISGNTTRTR